MLRKHTNQFDISYEQLCRQELTTDCRISEAATLLVMLRSGIVIDDTVIEKITDRLASLADETGYLPDDIQQALHILEPELAQDYI